ARAALTGEPPVPEVTLTRLAAGGTLAVCGPGARELAATLVLAAQPEVVEVHGPHADAWAWTRWLAEKASPGKLSPVQPTSGQPAPGQLAPGPIVVVVDGAAARPEWAGPGRVLLLVDPEHVPSWCAARLESSTWHGPQGERGFEVLPGS